jgi:hypothetical protein
MNYFNSGCAKTDNMKLNLPYILFVSSKVQIKAKIHNRRFILSSDLSKLKSILLVSNQVTKEEEKALWIDKLFFS